MSLIQRSKNLWEFRDTCNVYVLRRGTECVLIDAGSGAVIQHLAAIGIERVDWVLHTHHHRDQCWGMPILRQAGAKIAVPEYERHLFENVEAYWESRRVYDNYNDSNTFFSLGENLPVDAVLEDYSTFIWNEYEFQVIPAKGHTYGMVSLITEVDGEKIAFTGDLMSRGGKLYQLHAMEYAYGDCLGVEFTMQSIVALNRKDIKTAYPSHGAPIDEVRADITSLESRLEALANIGRLFTSGRGNSFRDLKTVRESRLQKITEHLLWAGPYTCSNFYIVLSGSGHAMLIDYGLASQGHLHFGNDHDAHQVLRFVEHHIDQLRDDYGVQNIELVVPTQFMTTMSVEYRSSNDISARSAGLSIVSPRSLPIQLRGPVRRAASTNRSKCNGSSAMTRHFAGEDSTSKFFTPQVKLSITRLSWAISMASGSSLAGQCVSLQSSRWEN